MESEPGRRPDPRRGEGSGFERTSRRRVRGQIIINFISYNMYTIMSSIFKCNCGYTTNSLFEYTYHEKEKKCLNRYKYNCMWCNYRSNSIFNITFHCTTLCVNKPCKSFKKIKRYTFCCQCPIVYYDYNEYLMKKKKCPCLTYYPCPYCTQIKNPNIDIYKHMRDSHPEYVQNGYICCICLTFLSNKYHHICSFKILPP